MAYPSSGYPVTEFLINGTWVDVSNKVRAENDSGRIVITRGRANEQGRYTPQTSSFKLNNADGTFSNRNPMSTYFGLLPRNTQVRHFAGKTDFYMRYPYDQSTAGTQLNYTYTADKATLDIVGDLEVRVDIQPDTWRPVVLMVLASKYTITGNQRSWAIYMNYDGTITLAWSTDGTAANRVFATSTAVIPVTSGRLSIKVTLDVNNGAAGNTVAFYTATTISGVYTQLGTSVVTAGVTSIFSSSAPLVAGAGFDYANLQSSGQAFAGHFYGINVYNGIGGTVVANADFTAWTMDQTSKADTAGTPNTWLLSGLARISTDRCRFWGELSSLPQRWDNTARDVWVPVEAGGQLRRLTQGETALSSPLYRTISSNDGIAGYWPLEDASDSTSAATATPGASAATAVDVTFAAATDLRGATQAPSLSLATAKLLGQCATVSSTGTVDIAFLFKLPSIPASNATLVSFYMAGGSIARIDFLVGPVNYTFQVYDTSGALAGSAAATFGGSTYEPTHWIAMNIEVNTSGSDITHSERWIAADQTTIVGIGPTTITGNSIGRPLSFRATAANESAYVGANLAHVIMANNELNFQTSDYRQAGNGWNGELAARRMYRLAAEESVTLDLFGVPANTAAMGYQTAKTLVDLFYDCADSDGGMLFELRDALSLAYATRQWSENRRDLTLAYHSNQLSEAPQPTEDDDAITNDVTVTRVGGSSARSTVDTGALSTQAPPNGIGRYATALSALSLGADSQCINVAGWKTHIGTINEARMPQIKVGLHRTQFTGTLTLQAQAFGLDVGQSLYITGWPSFLPPDPTLLLVQGYTEELGRYIWDLTYNTTPASGDRTGRYDIDSIPGYTRYDTTGSTLNTSITTTGTTVKLDYSTTGDNWTTNSGSYPFDIMLDGEQMTLTAAPGGSTSPQTFTGVTRSVNGIVKAHTAGVAASLYLPFYYDH